MLRNIKKIKIRGKLDEKIMLPDTNTLTPERMQFISASF